MGKYIDAEKLKEEIARLKQPFKKDIEDGVYPTYLCALLDFEELIEQSKLYKDESLGSPDYERGFKHGRDYQSDVERKYTNKDKVVAYLVDKGYPVCTKGEIPTYQETFDMIKNAIKYANQQKQSDLSNNLVDVDAVREDFITEVYRVLDADSTNDRANAIIGAFDSLPTICQEQSNEQPEYGYITTKYIPGKKPRWKVGSVLAYYINNSDEEGENVLGKVVGIERDEDAEWLYTFENEDVWDEETLIREGTYEK